MWVQRKKREYWDRRKNKRKRRNKRACRDWGEKKMEGRCGRKGKENERSAEVGVEMRSGGRGGRRNRSAGIGKKWRGEKKVMKVISGREAVQRGMNCRWRWMMSWYGDRDGRK